MSDISDQSSFALGLANINSQNFGPTATTNQANTNANTAVQSQQAQAAAMQNKLMQARMPLILSQLHDDSVGAGDKSGVDVSNNSPMPAGAGGAGSAPRTPGESIAGAGQVRGGAGPELLSARADRRRAALEILRARQYTQQEMQAADAEAYLVDPQDQYGRGPKYV
jgi:hypothetical protein